MKSIITCKNYQKEIQSITNDEFTYYYHFPLCLSNKQAGKDVIQEIIDAEKLDEYSVFCCDLCKKSHKNKKANIHSKPLCFYQVLNKETVDYYIKKHYYITTPGWIVNWKEYVQDEWEFSQDIAADFFKESFHKILLLDTGVYPNIEDTLKEFCSFIEKDYEILPVGLDYYKNYFFKQNHATAKDKDDKVISNLKNQLVNFTMSVELIKNISSFTEEDEILNKIFDILRMMFMPRKICYTPFINGELQKETCLVDYHLQLTNFLKDVTSDIFWLDNNSGFASKIYYGEELLGILILDDIYLPQYKEVYYNTFLSIKNVIALTLHNSRLYEQILTVNKDYQEQKSYFEQLYKNSPEMILITNTDYIVQSVNDSFKNFFDNITPIGMHINSFISSYSDNFDISLKSNKQLYPKPIIDFNFNNNTLKMELSHYTINVLQETVGFYIILNDVTERVSMQERLKELAFNDSLTGLYNRTFCDVEMNRLSKNRQLPLGIIIGDVNGLKITNDAFGHIAGDNILVQVASIIKSSCREGDIVSRWGGDEFVVILPNSNIEILKRITNRIQSKCEEYKGFEFVIPSISLGYAVLNSANRTISQTFIDAENMMYENKLLQKSSIRSRIVKSLESSLYEKSFETEEHAKRVSKMCVTVGKHLGFDNKQLNELEVFAKLHDIGKLQIDNVLLEKAEKLTAYEWKLIQQHSESGYRIAKSISELSHIANFILNHHERWDGTGYPNRTKGYQIPIQSRILSIADSIDAMMSERPYKKAYSVEKTIDELEKNKGSQFDPTLVDLFIEMFFETNNLEIKKP